MDCNTNRFVEIKPDDEGVEVKIQSGELIEFSLGQRFALNGYWFEVAGITKNSNELILRGVEPTEKQKKKTETFYAIKAREEFIKKCKLG
jgi:hypothetical protein